MQRLGAPRARQEGTTVVVLRRLCVLLHIALMHSEYLCAW